MEKRTRDKEGTRQKILDAAEQLFADKGFAGTSMAAISGKSGVSSGLILHHYKTKDNLYSAVRERLAQKYGRELLKNFAYSGDDHKMSEETIRTAMRFFMENNHYKRISLWSYLEGKQDLVTGEARITARMGEMIKTGQREGKFRKEYTPDLLLAVMKGSIDYWLRYSDHFREVLAPGCSREEYNNAFINQLNFLFMELLGIRTGFKKP